MTREEELFKKRLLDLADTAWQRGIPAFTDFLNLNEQNIYHDSLHQLSFIESRMFGGYEGAERQMVAFIPDALSFDEEQFPIACLRIRPLNAKFSDKLSHRDYLGSLMNLGIDRAKTGDILLMEEEACLFCHEKLADYLQEELTRIRHTVVMCSRMKLKTRGADAEEKASGGENSEANFEDMPELQFAPRLQDITGTVSSVRLDALLSLAFNTSRSSLTGLIEGGKTFVNGRLITSNGYHPKEGDIVSVRGYGRFRYCGMVTETKKGRCLVKIQKYL